jgi:hypothetical protein
MLKSLKVVSPVPLGSRIHKRAVACRSVGKEVIRWYGWTMVYNINNKNTLEMVDPSFVTAAQFIFSTAASFSHQPVISYIKPPEKIFNYTNFNKRHGSADGAGKGYEKTEFSFKYF